MKTTTYMFPLLLVSLFVGARENRGEETTKMQNDVNVEQPENGRPSEGFSLSIQVKQADLCSKEPGEQYLHAGRTMYLVATVTNVSQDKRIFVETDPKIDFHLEVLDSDGKPVLRTLYGKIILQQQDNLQGSQFRTVSNKVLPGKSLKYELNLSRQFDLSLEGTYSVQASCKVGRKQMELKSKVITFDLR